MLRCNRECYCAQYISALSVRLPDSSCNLPCIDNNTEICGGPLALSVYQAKSSAQGGGIRAPGEAPVGSILALGIAIGVLLCLV